MPTKKTTKKKAAKKATKQYVAEAKVLGKLYKAKGETIYEAIGNLKPGGVAGMVILSISNESQTKERVIPHMMAKRMFNTIGLTREVCLKNVSNMFQGI